MQNEIEFKVNIKALAYYFFENHNISKLIKSYIKTTYKKFILKYDNLKQLIC